MTNTRDYPWPQGEDLEITMVYKTGETKETVTPKNLTGYSLRMDICIHGADPATSRLVTFNSSDDAGSAPVDQPGTSDNEVTLGTDGTIYILAPRSLTLPGGAIYEKVKTGFLHFDYDVFLRNPDGRQKKILKGKLTVEPSSTLWT